MDNSNEFIQSIMFYHNMEMVERLCDTFRHLSFNQSCFNPGFESFIMEMKLNSGSVTFSFQI